MKRNMETEWYIILGVILFIGGATATLYVDNLWPVLITYLGIGFVVFSAVSFNAKWKEVFASDLPLQNRMQGESLFLARLFLTACWVLRRRGITSAVEFSLDKNYPNFVYHMGKKMVLNGYKPEDIKGALQRAGSISRQKTYGKINNLRQLGMSILVIGLLGGITGGLVLGIRVFLGMNNPPESIICVCLLTVLSLLLSIIIGILLPGRLHSYWDNEKNIQQQVIRGHVLIQEGVAPTEILRSQLVYLNSEEQDELLRQPFLDEYKDVKVLDVFFDPNWSADLNFWKNNGGYTYEH